jgi:hypothetical protein
LNDERTVAQGGQSVFSNERFWHDVANACSAALRLQFSGPVLRAWASARRCPPIPL